jgi:hypothetical protein
LKAIAANCWIVKGKAFIYHKTSELRLNRAFKTSASRECRPMNTSTQRRKDARNNKY